MTWRRPDRRLTDGQIATVRYQSTGYRGSEALILLARPGVSIAGATPMFYCHGLLGDAAATASWPAVRNLRYIAHAGIPVILADYGGLAPWANDDVVDPAGAIDDAIDFCAAEFGTRDDDVIAAGESMGSWGAAAWAWRNIDRTAALWLLAPIVEAEAFYDANPGMQGSIESAYGGLAGLQASWPTHDPGQNTAALGPLRTKTRLDLSMSDDLIDPSLPIGWADEVGIDPADVHVHPGGHDSPYLTIDPRLLAEWAVNHTRLHRYL